MDNRGLILKIAPKMKLWRVIKETGGLYNVLYFLGFLIAYHYQKWNAFKDIISTLYQIEDNISKKEVNGSP